MDTVDTIVIGAGVIGLAVAERLTRGRSVLVLERNDGFGRETSSRNSEVIHSGMYYAEDLLKTSLCVSGRERLYELCTRAGIPHRRCGKMVVATDEAEVGQLHAILMQARRNGVEDARIIGPREMADLEPHVRGILALHSPSSGIVDTHRLMAYLERSAVDRGATVAYGCEVTGIERDGGRYVVALREPGDRITRVAAASVVNSAGLHADRVAAMAGVDVDAAGYRIHWCKGEYFRISDRHRGRVSRLVYPTPTPHHLGAHVPVGLDGALRLGPNTFYVNTLDYTVDPADAAELYDRAARFLPFLERADLSPDIAGIRPKLYRRGGVFRDFVIREETERGLPGLVNLVGMESPGLTACLEIALRVESLL